MNEIQITKGKRNVNIKFLNDQHEVRKAVKGGIDKKYLFAACRQQRENLPRRE